jgi:leucyl aminopeptidase (aminopeptidase T)
VGVGLAVAAQRLVEQSLVVVPGESVLLVYDLAHEAIAEAVTDAVRRARSETIAVRLEDLEPRPHASLHRTIKDAIPRAQASLLLVDFHRGELQMRTEMVELALAQRLRHGHMVGVTRASMVAGFSVDPARIAQKSRELVVRLRPDARILVRSGGPGSAKDVTRSAQGTEVELVIALAPHCRWVDFGCIVGSGKRVNLPGGELVTSPESVDGAYVANGTLGDADGAFNRSLQATPITLRIAGSRVKAVECPSDPALARAVTACLARTPNLDRVGLVSFGVNLGLTTPIGDVFSDQKIPGVHLSLGETFPQSTGATWTSKSWMAFTSVEHDADIDKTRVLRRGRYVF